LEEPELNAHPVRLCVMHSMPLAVAANIMLRSN